jgi:hypothetical protein
LSHFQEASICYESFEPFLIVFRFFVAQVALEAGNSPQMIFQHYRELMRPKEAKAWFAIEPRNELRVEG